MSTELDTIYAGATLDFLVETLTSYPASAGWGLRLVLNPQAGGTVRTIDSVAEGDAHRLQATAAATGAWAVGAYSRQAWVIKGAEQYPVTDLFGQTQVRPGLGAAGGADMRLQAEKTLAAIEAMMSGSASGDVKRYRINGRELERYDPEQLVVLHSFWQRRVAEERRAAGLKDDGRGSVRKIMVQIR